MEKHRRSSCPGARLRPQIRMNQYSDLGQGESDPCALHRRDLDEQRHGNHHGEDTQRFFQPVYAISGQRIQALSHDVAIPEGSVSALRFRVSP